MLVLARGIRLPSPARRFMDRLFMQYLHWGTTGPMWHRAVLASTAAAAGAGGAVVVRRGVKIGEGRHRRGLTTDATGRLDIDRELGQRSVRDHAVEHRGGPGA